MDISTKLKSTVSNGGGGGFKGIKGDLIVNTGEKVGYLAGQTFRT